MTKEIKAGKATPLAVDINESDIKPEVPSINPNASTKTNEEMLIGLEKFAPQQISESGKSIYADEHKTLILDQLQSLLAKGHNLTMTKKALAVYHNINTGTLDKWRKSSEDPQSAIKTDDVYPPNVNTLTAIDKHLDTILQDIKSLEQKIKDAKQLITTHKN